MSVTPSSSPCAPHSCPPPGPHRVKGGEHEAGDGPLQKELLWRGEGQAEVECKLGGGRGDTDVTQGGDMAPGEEGVGASPDGLHKRSLSSSAQGPSWLGVQLHLGDTRPHVHQRPWGQKPLGLGDPHTLPTPGSLPPTYTLSPMEMGTPSLAWEGKGDKITGSKEPTPMSVPPVPWGCPAPSALC